MKKLSQINEHLWSGIIHRSESGEIRKENGVVVGKTKDGIALTLSTEDSSNGELYEVNGESVFYLFELDTYFCVVQDGDYDSYYRYEPDVDVRDEVGINMVSWFSGVIPELKTLDFSWLKAIVDAAEVNVRDLESLDTEEYNYKYDEIDFEVDGKNFKSFDNCDNAEVCAIDDCEEFFEGNGVDKDTFKRFIKNFGYTFFNTNSMNDDLVSMYENDWDDMNEDDKIKWLIEHDDEITETEEYFETDEDGEIDLDQPKFDTSDYQDEYVGYNTDKLTDKELVQQWIEIYGFEEDRLKDYIDYHELAKLCIDADGVAHQLARYDGNEIETDKNGHTYYFYRV
jgi:hypothetical protein